MVANVLVKVAHDTAKTFAKFPDIMTKIGEEATNFKLWLSFIMLKLYLKGEVSIVNMEN